VWFRKLTLFPNPYTQYGRAKLEGQQLDVQLAAYLLNPATMLMACRLFEAHWTYVAVQLPGSVGAEDEERLRAGRARIAAMLEERVRAEAKVIS
jgi:hypothetical protein